LIGWAALYVGCVQIALSVFRHTLSQQVASVPPALLLAYAALMGYIGVGLQAMNERARRMAVVLGWINLAMLLFGGLLLTIQHMLARAWIDGLLSCLAMLAAATVQGLALGFLYEYRPQFVWASSVKAQLQWELKLILMVISLIAVLAGGTQLAHTLRPWLTVVRFQPVRAEVGPAFVYDRARNHYEAASYPPSLPRERAFIHIGMFLGWMVQHDLCSDKFRDAAGPLINEFLQRRMTGPQLFLASDGVLANQDLNAEGNAFAKAYYTKSGFFSDYRRTLAAGLPTPYHVTDGWEPYDRLSAVITQRYDAWKAAHPSVTPVKPTP